MSFNSWQSYWKFQSAIRNKNRYIFDEETEYFLSEVLSSCNPKKISRAEPCLLLNIAKADSFLK